MHVVEGISDRVVALDHGVKIAEGSFEARRDERAGRRGLPRPEEDGDEVSANGAPPRCCGSTAVDTYYGPIHILQGIAMQVGAGRARLPARRQRVGQVDDAEDDPRHRRSRAAARVEFAGEDVTKRPTNYRIRKGMAIVPENRRLFAPMTVLENLKMGAYLRGGGDARGLRARLRRSSRASTSGATSSPGRSRAASSRWSRWGAR